MRDPGTEAAIRAVGEHAAEVWKREALEAAHRVALRLQDFTADDIWDEIPPEVRTHEHRAMGHVLRTIVKNGWARLRSCDHCGTIKVMRASRRSVAHTTDMAVYDSLVWDGTASAPRTPRLRRPPTPPLKVQTETEKRKEEAWARARAKRSALR